MEYLIRILCLYMFQLIIATMPDPKHGKSPSIVTEDNIQLLFEVQEKVLLSVGAAFWFHLNMCKLNHLTWIQNCVLLLFFKAQFSWSDLYSIVDNPPIHCLILTGWWNFCQLFRLNGIFNWHLLEASWPGLCHSKYSAGFLMFSFHL